MKGVLHDARLESQSARFLMSAARRSRRPGAQHLPLREGRFTTCRCPEPASATRGCSGRRTADLEIGGYGTARNTTFDVLGVPVVWLPWMMYPLKTERQTGLLFPSLGRGASRASRVGQPFFWAVGEQK